MYNIWLYFEVWCSLNSFSWNVDVNPSKRRNPTKRPRPYTLSPASAFFDEMLPVKRNS